LQASLTLSGVTSVLGRRLLLLSADSVGSASEVAELLRSSKRIAVELTSVLEASMVFALLALLFSCLAGWAV
jgi:hypothetical protein